MVLMRVFASRAKEQSEVTFVRTWCLERYYVRVNEWRCEVGIVVLVLDYLTMTAIA